MPSSDSEGFESADEGRSSIDKKERKKRLSSSNYSDNTLESDAELKKDKETVKEKNTAQTEGWDDFEFNDNDESKGKTHTVPVSKEKSPSNKPDLKEKVKIEEKSQDTGWDDFDDWGNDNITTKAPTKSQSPDPDIKAVTDRLSAATTSGTSTTPTTGSGWGWGWGVDSLLSSTTAGLTTFTNQVSQGITSVLETGIGAPDPEELARQAAASKTPDEQVPQEPGDKNAGDAGFSFGSILKFVGDTGTNIIAGGLDTLETIGRKAMDVLQEGDPYLAKKRALLGLDPDKPVLSQVLREAKAKAEEEDRIREEKREAKEIHYENLFDDFGGLVHLEALEMLSKQINMRIEEQLRNAKPADRSEMKETLQQVIELCEMPDDEESSDEDEDQDKLSPAENFHQKLVAACADLSIQLQFSPIVKHYTETLDHVNQQNSELTVKGLHKRAIGDLAQATALSVELYHKASEQMAVLTRRSTADEADAITRLTVVLTKHVNHLATLFTVKLQEVSTPEEDEQAKAYITNIFLEADNSSSYIHSAFLLTQPILQIGSI